MKDVSIDQQARRSLSELYFNPTKGIHSVQTSSAVLHRAWRLDAAGESSLSIAVTIATNKGMRNSKCHYIS